MKIKSLQFELRLTATSYLGEKVKKAKISFIKQKGDYKSGVWGDANKKVPKIYILRQNKEILYVGITKTLLSHRFGFGLNASGKNGYHGYSWKALAKKSQSKAIDLFVYIFADEIKTESIEAEVAYLIRNLKGRWPKYQTEIHFHQATKKEKQIAGTIYKQISK